MVLVLLQYLALANEPQLAHKTIFHPAQNCHYSSNARGRHTGGCPTGVGLTRRQVSVPWGVKSITNSSRYNAQRDKKVEAAAVSATAVSELVRSAGSVNTHVVVPLESALLVGRCRFLRE